MLRQNGHKGYLFDPPALHDTIALQQCFPTTFGDSVQDCAGAWRARRQAPQRRWRHQARRKPVGRRIVAAVEYQSAPAAVIGVSKRRRLRGLIQRRLLGTALGSTAKFPPPRRYLQPPRLPHKAVAALLSSEARLAAALAPRQKPCCACSPRSGQLLYPHLCATAQSAWVARWGALLAVAAQRAQASSLPELPLVCEVNGCWPTPAVQASRLPTRPL